jgi:hypothetical protein
MPLTQEKADELSRIAGKDAIILNCKINFENSTISGQDISLIGTSIAGECSIMSVDSDNPVGRLDNFQVFTSKGSELNSPK